MDSISTRCLCSDRRAEVGLLEKAEREGREMSEDNGTCEAIEEEKVVAVARRLEKKRLRLFMVAGTLNGREEVKSDSTRLGCLALLKLKVGVVTGNGTSFRAILRYCSHNLDF